jgi:hypothetical protein
LREEVMEKNVKYTVRLRIEDTYVGTAGVSVSTIHMCPHSYYVSTIHMCPHSYYAMTTHVVVAIRTHIVVVAMRTHVERGADIYIYRLYISKERRYIYRKSVKVHQNSKSLKV